MKISAKVDYAARVLAELARRHGSVALAQIDHLAEIEKVPPNFLAQILGELRQAGLITSRRGIAGGYALARPPEQISLYDIIVAIDGEILDLASAPEGRGSRRMREVWSEVREALVEKTRSYTLDKLFTKSGAAMYYI